MAGHEANGLALPPRVIETLGQSGIPQYVAIGEERYSDGRWYLEFAVNRAWLESTRPTCPECGGTGGDHDMVSFDDPKTGRIRQVRCPADTRPRKRAQYGGAG
jgi:hypothetical protein